MGSSAKAGASAVWRRFAARPTAFATVRKTPKSSQGISPLLGSPG